MLIKNLIEEGKIDEALKLLIKQGYEGVSLLSARYNLTRNDFNDGLITQEQYDVSRTKICHRLLCIANEIDVNIIPFTGSIEDNKLDSKLNQIENKIWDDLFLNRYYYECYELYFERLKGGRTKFSKDEAQMEQLFNIKVLCYEFANHLEDLWINFPQKYDKRFVEIYRSTKKTFEEKIDTIDKTLKLRNDKKIEAIAEENTHNYFNNIFKLHKIDES